MRRVGAGHCPTTDHDIEEHPVRSLRDQNMRKLGGRWSILARQKRDHVRVDLLLDELGATDPGAEQDRILHKIAHLVFTHASAEESVLWPEVRRRLPDGTALIRQLEQQHQEVNQLWTTLERSLSDDRRRTNIDRLIAVIRTHVRAKEEVLVPRLLQSVSTKRLWSLGIAWELVRRTAPDRPHPDAQRGVR